MGAETDDFDLKIERELHQVLDPMVAGPIPIRHTPRRVGFVVKVLGSAAAALAAKTATGIAIAALAVGTAGAATEVVLTRSLNPADWGHQITLDVRTFTGEHSRTPEGNAGKETNETNNGTSTLPGTQSSPTSSAAAPGQGRPVQVPTVAPGRPAVSPLPPLPNVSPPPINPVGH
jgi:hypothetical protein